MSKNQRKISSQIIYPKTQLKFSLLTAMIVFLSSLALFVVNNSISQKVLDAVDEAKNPLVLDTVEALLSYQRLLFIGINLISMLTVFLVTILITHRFLGPLTSIIRYLEEIKVGEKRRLIQRTDDGLGPLFDYLETVDLTVKDKVK